MYQFEDRQLVDGLKESGMVNRSDGNRCSKWTNAFWLRLFVVNEWFNTNQLMMHSLTNDYYWLSLSLSLSRSLSFNKMIRQMHICNGNRHQWRQHGTKMQQLSSYNNNVNRDARLCFIHPPHSILNDKLQCKQIDYQK